MPPRLLAVLYAIEFLLALLAVYTVWGDVGGQNHLEFMAWYWKAAIGFAMAAGTVRLTVAAASDSPGARRRITLWTLALAVLAICAGLLSYYYHLIEPPDEDQDAPATVTPTACLPRPTAVHFLGLC